MDHGLALALDGRQNAIEGRLHADHLALHDLHGGRPRQRPEEPKRKSAITYQILAFKAGEASVDGRRWWDEHEMDTCGRCCDGGDWRLGAGREKTHSTLAVDKAWTFFFSGFSKTHWAPLSWQRRQGAWRATRREGPGRADGRADGTGERGYGSASGGRAGDGGSGAYGPRLHTCSCPCDSWCRPARPASGCGRQRRTRTHRGRRGNLGERPSRTGGRRLQRR